ncbi:MAG: NAD(P)H-dependent oxidoreductase subunit E [Thermoleophilaceae bacterium]|nr:NAD(P)H-dependent oxidoreductase subunit E [Thermoleophilaceae bacterium]
MSRAPGSAPAGTQRVPGAEARAGKFPGPSLIPKLTEIQRRHGWLPRDELVRLAREERRPLYEVEGLISFYPHFRTSPPPKVELRVCQDLSCWLHGGAERLAELRSRYGEDAEVEFHAVSCLGRCDAAPAAAVEERPSQAAEVERLVEHARGGPLPQAAARRTGERFPNDPYEPHSRDYRLLRAVLAGEIDGERVISELKEAGLRGMGGAGFPTGTKWELVARQEARPKYAICNADESEPGTFKDRQIMAEQPHLVLEGLLVGMAVTGADEGWVFIRHEYGPEEEVLREELERVRRSGLLEGTDLKLDVFVSPGGYILGEESALIECMEGHRGEPRNKPPFPGVAGLWGKPTLMNSVETLAHVPVILERGAEWWRSQGVNGGTGLKFFAVSGHVERPDVYCVPMGTTARELLEMAGGVTGGAEPAGFQPGGASSNFLGPEHLDVPLDFGPLQKAGSMLGSGALVAIAEGTDLLAAATNVLRFFRNESCGKCVPCRVGSHKAHEMLTEALARGDGTAPLEDQLTELEATLRLTSICGLGQVALGPVLSVMGMQRGATEARPQPRPAQPPDGASGSDGSASDGAGA